MLLLCIIECCHVPSWEEFRSWLMAIESDSSSPTSAGEYAWVFIDWFKARCLQINRVTFSVRRSNRLARRILCEGSDVFVHISATNAVSGTIYWLVAFNVYSWTLLFLDNVVFVSHKNRIVAWVCKLLPVINMVFFEITLIESLGFNCLATWQICSCEVSPRR